MWQPDAEQLAAIRRDIDSHPDALKDVLQQPGMRREFLGGVGSDGRKVVKTFVDQNKESALKTKPKVSLVSF